MQTILRPMSLLLLLAAASTVRADSSEAEKAILAFKLTMPVANNLLAALPEMTQYVLSLPDWKERIARAAKMSYAESIKSMEGDSKAVAIVKRHGLTPREYMVGILTLRYALLIAATSTRTALPPNIVASPENLSFAKSNLSVLKPKMDSADGGGGRK